MEPKKLSEITKSLVEIPITIIGFISYLSIQNYIILHPIIDFVLWVFISVYFVIFALIKLIDGGYKNDFEDRAAFGENWRPGLIAVILLLAPIFILVTVFFWGKTNLENLWLAVLIVILNLILCYFYIKFRFNFFASTIPKEKEESIKFIDLRKYLKWYHWVIFVIYLLIIFVYLLMYLGY